MTSASRNVYIDKLGETITMKHVDVKSSIYIDSSKENNEKGPKFKIGDIVRISKYKNIFAKVIFSRTSCD